MGYSNNKFSGGRSGGFNRDKQSFKATCAECNSSCTVPFKPNGRKPVLCSDCFQGSDSRDSGRSNYRDNSSYRDKKPARRSFDKPASRHCEADPKLLEEMNQIKRKLNRILDILQAVEIIEETDE